MKKKWLALLPALVMALSFGGAWASVNGVNVHGKVNYYWFSYSGNNTPSQEQDLSRYTFVGTSRPSCGGMNVLCAIQTTKAGTNPQLDLDGSGLVTTGAHIQTVDFRP